MRILFALLQGLRHRHALRALHCHGIERPDQLSLETLYQHGVRVLIWDFDGILAHHGASTPIDRMQPLLAASEKLFGANRVFVLSNKPLAVRDAYFKTHYPDIHFSYAPRKKPYPDGILHIIAQTQLPANVHCLIDDRLLTGGLASVLAGIQCVYCKKPFQCFRARFVAECFFALLRRLEKCFF